MGYRDLSDWLAVAERRGELVHINGAHWDLEMSSLAELVFRETKEPIPVMLFDQIPDYPEGYRTLFGLLSSGWGIAKALGLPEDQIDRMSLLKNWYNKRRGLQLIKPEVVTSSPVLSNSDTGERIDLLKFPVPRFHELDRSRYIGTCHTVIQRDPDIGYVNLGTYRNMVVDRNHIALHSVMGQHGHIITYEKYWAREQTMPVAIAIGMDPVLWWSSCQRDARWGVSEYDYAGGINGEPIEVIEGPYTGLPIPAHAEIVLEGECKPGHLVDEGPFGEWHGYYANRGLQTVQEPAIEVKAVHYRDNPILTCSQVAVPPHSSSLLEALSSSATIWNRLEAFGIAGIRGIWAHEFGSGQLFRVVSIKQLYGGHAREVSLLASHYGAGGCAIVVDDDIDPSNLEQVLWAVLTRTLLDRSIQILPHCRTSNINPAIPLSEKGDARKPFTAARVAIDGCRDLSWQRDWYPVAKASPELRARILDKWQAALPTLKLS